MPSPQSSTPRLKVRSELHSNECTFDVTEAGVSTLGAGGRTRYVMIPKHIPKEAVARLREAFPGMEIAQ